MEQAVGEIIDLVIHTIGSGEDPHSVALPEPVVASARRLLGAGISAQRMRRDSYRAQQFLLATVLEEIDRVPCSESDRATLRNEALEVHNVLLDRLRAAVLAE